MTTTKVAGLLDDASPAPVKQSVDPDFEWEELVSAVSASYWSISYICKHCSSKSIQFKGV